MERAACLYIFQIPHKNSPKWRNLFPSLKGPRKGAPPPCSPKPGPLWKQMSISRDLPSISFGVPSKGPLPPGSPYRAPSEREALFLEPSSIPLPKSLYVSPLPAPPVQNGTTLRSRKCVWTFTVVPPCHSLLHVLLHYFQSIIFRTRKVSIKIMFLNLMFTGPCIILIVE